MKNNEIETTNSLQQYFKEIKALPILTKEEEYQLFEEYRKGSEEAKKKLIESNLRLVVKIASEYRDKGLEYLDLIQEGSIGLIKSIEVFDHTKGYKLSTYATYKIKRYMKRAINDKARIIRIPTNKLDRINRFIIEKNELERQYERTLSKKELQEYFDLKEKEVEEYLDISKHTISLNQEVKPEESIKGKKIELIETLSSDEKPLEDEIVDKIMLEEIKEALLKLTPLERKVLGEKLGFKNGDPEKTADIAKEIKKSLTGVWFIYDRSIEKLKRYIYQEEHKKAYIRKRTNQTNEPNNK